ncbi:LysM peptidoglycan-binding domain-containing protein [Peribacillus butanolivorans]|uniref:C40 family peptidase n=1 Tax=Peribacillus butanolivorans TaxID=421767 RepID=UPI002E23FB10|nr:LysM peptidoglycan-binding domain-containing protein [Peribacillus butanolivorans]
MKNSKNSFILAGTIIGTLFASTSAYASSYQVKSGDTLDEISKANNTTVQKLKSENNLTSNLILPGQVLKINKFNYTNNSKVTTEKYVVKLGDSLSTIAKRYNLSLSALIKLNPEISNSDRIHIGQSIRVSGQASTSSPTVRNSSSSDTYKVKSGDTLDKIAKAHNTTVQKLKSNNNLTSNLILPGQVLKINKLTKYTNNSKVTTEKYVVKLGDSLSTIAKRYNLSFSALIKLNPNISNSDRIRIGQSIRVSGQASTSSSTANKSSSSKTYTVKSGDTLDKIAKAHNTTINSLLSLNPSISNANTIHTGQSIKLSGKATSSVAKKESISTNSAQADKILAAGAKYLGARYVYGASTSRTDIFDCSSFTLKAFQAVGISLPRTSSAQSQVGKLVSSNTLQKGDLVFFDTNNDGVINHVGIYAGNGQMLNASTSKGVSYANINSSYWEPRFVKAVRVL